MSWRTVVISNRCKLDLKMGYMVIRSDDTKRIFLDEVSVLIIENNAVSLTGCLLDALCERKIKVIFCDEKHNPKSELVPLYGSHDSSKRIREQIRWSGENKTNVWTRIVKEKICNQAKFLKDTGNEEEYMLLMQYVSELTPGDSTNREGHAAKVYFNAIFGKNFSRGFDCTVNSALNYGYTILLSLFNREISACGYLTQLGIFHDNIFNHFNLSCDLMEPFRVLVDMYVYNAGYEKFETEEKHNILTIFNEEVVIDSAKQTVINAVRLYTKSVIEAVESGDITGIRFARI